MNGLPIWKYLGHPWRTALTILIAALASPAMADPGSIQLSTFPDISVADAHSSVTITAIVRDSAGRTVPDGTQVFFTTTLGNLRDSATQTTGGLARVVLVAGGTAGSASIVASAPSVGATSTDDLEFLSDRSLLASAQEYAEIVSPTYLAMSLESKLLESSSPHYGVRLRYREISIAADSLQLDANSLEMKAKHARVSISGTTREYENLYLDLPQRRGFGTTSYRAKEYRIEPDGNFMELVATVQDRFGTVRITGKEVQPSTASAARGFFTFTDLSGSTMKVTGRKAVVFPRREVQFHKAEVVVQGSRTMKLPLFKVELNGQTPILTAQIINVNDNKLQIDYPYYLSLQPGLSSSLRFHTGDSAGTGFSSIGGAFLDYNLNWDRGDASQGNFTFGGIGRRDFQLSASQFLRIDQASTFSAQLNSPSLSSLFGTVDYGRDLGRYQFAATANAGRSLAADQSSSSQSGSLSLDSNPLRLGRNPVTLTYGLTGLSQSNSFGLGETASQTEMGAQARLQLLPQAIAPRTLFNSYMTVGQYYGENVNRFPTLNAGASVSQKLSKAFSLAMAYNFTDDPYSSLLQGQHQVSVQSGITLKKVFVSLAADRSLDIDRLSYQANMTYTLSPLWRFSYYDNYDEFFGTYFYDAGARFIYTLAGRDIGVVWSQTTKRFGVQILGATFN